MKTLSLSLLAAAIASGVAAAATAYTVPVGYTTTAPLTPNQFNLVSLTVHNSTIAAGVIDAESSGSITDNQINFTTLLGAANPPTTPTYILELPGGVIQEITSWSGSVLTTPQDITASVTPGTTKYKLRKAKTISEVFGAANSLGLTPSPDGSSVGVDSIQLFNGSGFDVIVYITGVGWFTEVGDPAGDFPIVHADGFYVRRAAGSTLNLVVTGEVKITPTSGLLATGFNYLGAVAPVGLTLATSGLDAYITPSLDGSPATSDNVQVQIGGGYRACVYITGLGWFDEGGDPAGTQPLDGGFLIQNRGVANRPYTLSVPTSYNNL